MTWQGRKVLITGGASFIGSHLTDALVQRGASVTGFRRCPGGHLPPPSAAADFAAGRCAERLDSHWTHKVGVLSMGGWLAIQPMRRV